MKEIIAVIAGFAACFGLAWIHPFGDPRSEAGKGTSTLLRDKQLSLETREMLIEKCADCHSNETRWPVYSRFAPASWLMERDILKARESMNLSHWDELSPDARDVLVAKMIRKTRDAEMPPMQYRFFHWNSRLTPHDLESLQALTRRASDEVDAMLIADPQRGEMVFQKRCTGCHAKELDREGPRLGGVFGRRAGSVPGFDYSDGLKKSGIVWDEETLERWLTDPSQIAPDTKMDFRVPKAQERRDLIAYLRR